MTGIARLYDAGDGSLERTFPGPASDYTGDDFSPTGDRMLVGYDGTRPVKVQPLAPGAAGETIQLKVGTGSATPRFSAGRQAHRLRRLLRITSTCARWRPASRSSSADVPKGIQVYDLSFSADGKRVAVVGEESSVLVWRLDRPQRPERDLKGYRGHVNSMAYANDGRIVTAGADRTVRIWSATGDHAAIMRGHTDEVNTVQINQRRRPRLQHQRRRLTALVGRAPRDRARRAPAGPGPTL